MGTALTDAQINAVAKLAPKALFCQDPDRAGQESVARGIAALRGVNADRTTRGVEFRIVRLPSKQDPADVVQHAGADAMRELLAKAVEIERFEVERALEQPDASRDDMLAMTTPLIASLPASVLREDLIQLVANRLGIRPEVIMEVVRGASAAAAPAPAWNGGERPWNGDRRDGKPWRGGGRDRYRPPAPPPEPVDPRAAFVRRERSEEAFLSYCIAMPEQGDARLANVDIDDYFSSPATRKAAAHIRGRLRSPNANLPAGRRGPRAPRGQAHGRGAPAGGDAREARAGGAPTRTAPARAPHLRGPAVRRYERRRGARGRARASAGRVPA